MFKGSLINLLYVQKEPNVAGRKFRVFWRDHINIFVAYIYPIEVRSTIRVCSDKFDNGDLGQDTNPAGVADKSKTPVDI